MFKNNKKFKLDQNTKYQLIKEFGTYDKNEIEKITKKLMLYYIHVRNKNINLIFSEDYIKNNRIKILQMLTQCHIHVARERVALKLDNNTLSTTEKVLIELDNKILEKQLLNYGYSKESALQVIKNIRKLYQATKYNLISNDIDCYKIDKDLNVTLLPAKKRYLIAKEKLNVLEKTL